MKMGKTLHPTPHTLPPRETFCRKPYLGLAEKVRGQQEKDN
jgi:hypothetical protein